MRAVIGTIPPIPIPFANFGMELTPNSNSSLGIGATTPTPIQRNWGDSKGFQCLFWNQLKKLKKDVNQVSLVVFWTASDTWMERGKFKHVESLGIPPIPWNWSWSWPPNSTRGVGIGAFQKSIPKNRNWSVELWIDPNSFPMTAFEELIAMSFIWPIRLNGRKE